MAGDLRGLINETNKARTEAETEGKSGFDDEYIEKFFQAFNRIMLKAIEENKGEDNYYGNEERKLINRITDYKDNYFAWVANFEFPFTNNLSERSLRGAKSKMKISGQFQTIEYAGHYAAIKSYIETCYRNGINKGKFAIYTPQKIGKYERSNAVSQHTKIYPLRLITSALYLKLQPLKM